MKEPREGESEKVTTSEIERILANRAAAGLDEKDEDPEENGDDRQEEDDLEDYEGEKDDEDVIIIQSAFRKHGLTYRWYVSSLIRKETKIYVLGCQNAYKTS